LESAAGACATELTAQIAKAIDKVSAPYLELKVEKRTGVTVESNRIVSPLEVIRPESCTALLKGRGDIWSVPPWKSLYPRKTPKRRFPLNNSLNDRSRFMQSGSVPIKIR